MQADVLIIGSGIAGAAVALRLAKDEQRQIILATRAAEPNESNSIYAQGGIVGRSPEDSAEILKEDILKAGAGICNEEAVDLLAEYGPDILNEILIDQVKVPFDRDKDGEIAYGLEGAHSARRVLHVRDSTGRAIMLALLKAVEEKTNITILTRHTAIDLITTPHHSTDPLAVYEPVRCRGAYLLNQAAEKVITITAPYTILATGGLGQIFTHTTNPVGARGDGLAMAYRAGARLINNEYVQFHPTAMDIPGTTKFLISEAVRGEGAVLLTPKGDPFMEKYSPEWKDLAPRDVVARAIYTEMLENDYPHVFLDIASHKPSEYIRERFPKIYEVGLGYQFDLSTQPVPVVPAAHYFCGGIAVDLWGKTSLNGLYAIGEAACTGVHGANRLASTSLLESLLWADRAAFHISDQRPEADFTSEIAQWSDSGLTFESDPALIMSDFMNVRNLMWHYVGLFRNEYRLKRAIHDLRYLRYEIEEFYRKTRVSDELIGLRNGVQIALVVGYSARRNRYSRGCHYREDSLV